MWRTPSNYSKSDRNGNNSSLEVSLECKLMTMKKRSLWSPHHSSESPRVARRAQMDSWEGKGLKDELSITVTNETINKLISTLKRAISESSINFPKKTQSSVILIKNLRVMIYFRIAIQMHTHFCSGVVVSYYYLSKFIWINEAPNVWSKSIYLD